MSDNWKIWNTKRYVTKNHNICCLAWHTWRSDRSYGCLICRFAVTVGRTNRPASNHWHGTFPELVRWESSCCSWTYCVRCNCSSWILTPLVEPEVLKLQVASRTTPLWNKEQMNNTPLKQGTQQNEEEQKVKSTTTARKWSGLEKGFCVSRHHGSKQCPALAKCGTTCNGKIDYQFQSPSPIPVTNRGLVTWFLSPNLEPELRFHLPNSFFSVANGK